MITLVGTLHIYGQNDQMKRSGHIQRIYMGLKWEISHPLTWSGLCLSSDHTRLKWRLETAPLNNVFVSLSFHFFHHAGTAGIHFLFERTLSCTSYSCSAGKCQYFPLSECWKWPEDIMFLPCLFTRLSKCWVVNFQPAGWMGEKRTQAFYEDKACTPIVWVYLPLSTFLFLTNMVLYEIKYLIFFPLW